MKTVKIQFSGVWKEFEPEKLFLYQILKKHYDVQITEDADYVICSSFRFYEYINCPQVRIFFSGENYIPDFNHVDYAISSYPIEFMDRHFCFPGLVDGLDIFRTLAEKDRNYPASVLAEKPYFANFISSHDSEHNLRSKLFHALSEYKRIESVGSLLYNMPNGEKVNREDGSKLAFQKKCKFTICPESTNHTGFMTEKILEAFAADTIPIYYGSSTVTDMINRDAFINLADFDSLQAAVDRIIELDRDDEKYLQMLRQPIFAQSDFVDKTIAELERFVCYIFDQPLEEARRRCCVYMPNEYANDILHCRSIMEAEQPRKDRIVRRKQRIGQITDAVLGSLNSIGKKLFGEKVFLEMKEKLKSLL